MNILTILAHPSKDSFNNALLNQYIKGAKKNHKVKTLYLGDLDFDPILHEGYKEIQELEPDLKNSQDLIKWADKITIFTPVWWTTPPAILKGFFDRIMLPDFGYKFADSYSWTKLLKNKSARIVATMDSPWWYYKFIIGDPLYKQIKGTLGFCGISPINKTYICNLKSKTNDQRKEVLKQLYKIGQTEIQKPTLVLR